VNDSDTHVPPPPPPGAVSRMSGIVRRHRARASSTATVRTATPGDTVRTARLEHQESFRSSHLRVDRRLGTQLHERCVTDPRGIAFVATALGPRGRERVLGYLLGTADRDVFEGTGTTGFLADVPWAPTDSWSLKSQIRRLDLRADLASVAEVTELVVRRGLRGRGIGSSLMKEFRQLCTDLGVQIAELVVPVSAEELPGFLGCLGWRFVGVETGLDGAHRYRFQLDVTPAEEASRQQERANSEGAASWPSIENGLR
jgi:GNAT superfamily N-acetyltransferase